MMHGQKNIKLPSSVTVSLTAVTVVWRCTFTCSCHYCLNTW